MSLDFPPIEMADEDGLLAVGGELNVENLVMAYLSGIFPWPITGLKPMAWFAPDPRGVIEVKNMHFPKSLLKHIKKNKYDIRFNQDFNLIISHCAKAKRPGQRGTWINRQIIHSYEQMFENKKAYCIAVYENEKMIGGLYGVAIGEIVSAESMFYLKDNASKVALYYLLIELKKQGIPLLDTQMITPTVASFGGDYITRNDFMLKLKKLNPHAGELLTKKLFF